MPDRSLPPLDEADALSALDALVEAFSRTDTTAYFACLAPEATFLFHSEPEVIAGRAAYRALWDSWVTGGLARGGVREQRPAGAAARQRPPSSRTGCGRPSAPPRASSGSTSGRPSWWPAATTASSASCTSTCPSCPPPRPGRPGREPGADRHRASPGGVRLVVDHRGRDVRRRADPRRGPHRPPAGPVPGLFRRRQHLRHQRARRFPILFGLSFWQGAAATVARPGPRRARARPDGGVRTRQRHQQRGQPPAPTSACTAGSSARSCRC